MPVSPQRQTLKQRLQARERVNVFAVGRAYHPNLIDIYARHGGFQAFWIDAEHAGFTAREIEEAAAHGRACGLDCFVRLPPTDYASATRVLESGVGGVMAAQIMSAEHAEQFVQWCKFAPRGCRGLNSGGFDGQYGNLPLDEYCRLANATNFVAVQIETVSALEECDQIAAVDGVDHLFLGPADMSQALGVTGDFLHPRCLDAIARVAAACEKAGKTWGALTTSSEHARVLLDHGCLLVSPTNDVRTFNQGILAVKNAFGELFD